jgi:hypothetical protein
MRSHMQRIAAGRQKTPGVDYGFGVEAFRRIRWIAETGALRLLK